MCVRVVHTPARLAGRGEKREKGAPEPKGAACTCCARGRGGWTALRVRRVLVCAGSCTPVGRYCVAVAAPRGFSGKTRPLPAVKRF